MGNDEERGSTPEERSAQHREVINKFREAVREGKPIGEVEGLAAAVMFRLGLAAGSEAKIEELEAMMKAYRSIRGAERRAFVRQAAIAIYTEGMSSPPAGSFNVGKAPTVTFSPRTCWEAAKALWNEKPEDC